jgi:hypothetical protein
VCEKWGEREKFDKERVLHSEFDRKVEGNRTEAMSLNLGRMHKRLEQMMIVVMVLLLLLSIGNSEGEQ